MFLEAHGTKKAYRGPLTSCWQASCVPLRQRGLRSCTGIQPQAWTGPQRLRTGKLKVRLLPWPVGLSWVSGIPCTKRSLAQGHGRHLGFGLWLECMWEATELSLSLFLSLPPPSPPSLCRSLFKFFFKSDFP